LLLAAILGTTVLLEAQGAGCGLGLRWSESENGITGNWVRRGDSNVFDATWPGVSSVLTMTLTGNQLRIQRRDAGNQQVEYTAVIGPDGKTVTGTARVLPPVPAGWPTQPFPFRAAIQCGGQKPTASNIGLNGCWSSCGVHIYQEGETLSYSASWWNGPKETYPGRMMQKAEGWVRGQDIYLHDVVTPSAIRKGERQPKVEYYLKLSADGNEITGYWVSDGQRGGNVGWTRDKPW
jgi:hypothetical protein